MKPLRLGVICDLREEGWHSMDLLADMLLETLPLVAGSEIAATRLCPPMVRRWSRLPLVGTTARGRLGDRLTGRLWDYPRWLAPRVRDFDVFHIVDHSYAHLVRVLPSERTIVTCHDLDAVQAALPLSRRRLDPARWLASPVFDGLRRAGHVACVSQATRTELIATGLVKAERVSVVYEGVHPSCSPLPSPEWDAEIERLLGGARAPDHNGPKILHVGSTIARKRIDVLLQVVASLRQRFPNVTLIRVGGPMTPAQRNLAKQLCLSDAVVEMSFLERSALAALYRRASVVVLPSEREGFGFPVVEAMASGTPVVVSAIPALEEIGGSAAVFCPAGDVEAWVSALTNLLLQQQRDPGAWSARKQAAIAAAARFDWRSYASDMTKLYLRCRP